MLNVKAAVASQPAFGGSVPSIPETTRADKRSYWSAVLALFAKLREGEDGIVDADGEDDQTGAGIWATLRKRYRAGLNTSWKFLIDNGYVSGQAPDFSSSSKNYFRQAASFFFS
jgi:hypothetical protein